jgi:hypothetical protein
MQIQQANAVAATWILASGLFGLAGNVTTIGGAALMLGFGLVPPIIMMLRWNDPRQPSSERVHAARPLSAVRPRRRSP